MLNYSILLNALKAYNPSEPAEQADVTAHIVELEQTMRGDKERDSFQNGCYALPGFTALQLVDDVWYDAYREKRKSSPTDTVDPEEFIQAVRSDLFYESLPTGLLANWLARVDDDYVCRESEE